MLFTSSVFLFAFMPLFFVVYFMLPWRPAKNVCLLIASLVFYAWGEPYYIALMIASVAVNWILGIWVDSAIGHKRKALLLLAVTLNLGAIGLFKYEGFLAQNINALMGHEVLPDLNLPLPIGISFYTLQALSYIIDVYRGEVKAQHNILYLGMYVASFPQLIAGPIVRYSDIEAQVVDRAETIGGVSSGLRLFCIGMAKKVLLSNVVAILAARMLELGGPAIGAAGAWMGLIAYTFQIYFDFAGYSDMAVGLGRMMGFEYLRNFNYPYMSRSITEFWRRWHMSLSAFFRDYVYIPLGGSHCSKARNALNIAVVWALTGLWHGAAWNYIGWGMYYGMLLLGEKFIWGARLEHAPRPLQHTYTIGIFVFGWSFFWITDSGALISFWNAMCGQYGLTGSSTFWELTAWEYWPIFLICAVASTPLCPWLKERLYAWIGGRTARPIMSDGGVADPTTLSSARLCVMEPAPGCNRAWIWNITLTLLDAAVIFLFLASVASIVSGSFNPFIYFQF